MLTRSIFLLFIDAPLAREGREEAKKAGELLKSYGFEFDVVYTSWLSRAIETAWVSVIPFQRSSLNIFLTINALFINHFFSFKINSRTPMTN